MIDITMATEIANKAITAANDAKMASEQARTMYNVEQCAMKLHQAREASMASFALSVAALTLLAVGVVEQADKEKI